MKEFSLKRSATDQIVRKLDQRAIELDMDRREKNALLDSIKEGIPFAGMEFLLPYFYHELTSVFSYLPFDTLVCLAGADRVDAEVERFAKLAWDRNAKAKEEGRLVAATEQLFLNEHEWRAAIEPLAQVNCEALTIMAASERLQESTLTIESFLTNDIQHETLVKHGKEPSLAPLVERLGRWEDQKVIFVAPTRGDAGRLRELLGHYEIDVPVMEQPVNALLKPAKLPRAIVLGHLNQGFRLPAAGLVAMTFRRDLRNSQAPFHDVGQKAPEPFSHQFERTEAG